MWKHLWNQLGLHNLLNKRRFKKRVCIKRIWQSSTFHCPLGNNCICISAERLLAQRSKEEGKPTPPIQRLKNQPSRHYSCSLIFPIWELQQCKDNFSSTRCRSFPFTRTFTLAWNCRNTIVRHCSSYAIALWEAEALWKLGWPDIKTRTAHSSQEATMNCIKEHEIT